MSATKAATKPIIAKARLRNFGNGILEVSDDTVKFYVETGRLRKRRETVRNILILEIESLERQENDLSVTWKGNTDVFAVEATSQVLGIHDRILAVLKERQKTAETKTIDEQKLVEQKQTEQNAQVVQAAANAVEVANSLFGVLRHLHGRIDWKLVESSAQQVNEAVEKLASENENLAFLDVTPISSAVEQRYPKEITERALEALKRLHERFRREEPAPAEGPEQLHPSQHDANVILEAFYVWNDMTLGAIVGDKDFEKESAEMLRLLEELTKLLGSQIDIGMVKASFEKLSAGKEKQMEGFAEIKVMLDQQLKDLMSLASRASQEGSASV
jgi:hypothetical protein